MPVAKGTRLSRWVRLTCGHCGKGFERRASQKTEGNVYCSWACMHAPKCAPEERFWPRVERRGPDECWEWMAARNADGYGWIGAWGGRVSTHRFSWMLHNGQIPAGMEVCHTCDNPPCVNPRHLFLGPHWANMRDCVLKGRMRHAKLNENAVRQIRQALAAGATQRSLCGVYGVGHTMMDLIARRLAWKWVS